MPVFSTATIIAIAGAAVAIGGGIYAYTQQKKAAKAQKRAIQEQQRQDDLRQRRARIQAIREAQVKRAVIQNFAEVMGISGSSSPEGALASAGAQIGTNLGLSSFVTASNAKIGMFQQRSLDHQMKSQLGGAISGIGGQIFNFGASMPGAFSGLSSMGSAGQISATPYASPVSSPIPRPRGNFRAPSLGMNTGPY